MEHPIKITTIGKGEKEHEFWFRLDSNRDKISYLVYLNEKATGNIFFCYRIKLKRNIRPHLWVNDMIDNNGNSVFSGTGLPEALIEDVSTRFRISVYSSNRTANTNEYLTEQSDKVWKRLVKVTKAKYDEEMDRYVFEYTNENI